MTPTDLQGRKPFWPRKLANLDVLIAGLHGSMKSGTGAQSTHLKSQVSCSATTGRCRLNRSASWCRPWARICASHREKRRLHISGALSNHAQPLHTLTRAGTRARGCQALGCMRVASGCLHFPKGSAHPWRCKQASKQRVCRGLASSLRRGSAPGPCLSSSRFGKSGSSVRPRHMAWGRLAAVGTWAHLVERKPNCCSQPCRYWPSAPAGQGGTGAARA